MGRGKDPGRVGVTEGAGTKAEDRRRRFVDPWALSAAFPLSCLPSDLGTGVGLAAPLLQIFAKGLGQAPVPVFGFCSSPLGDAGPARIFPPAHKPRLPQMRDGGMVRGAHLRS